MENVEIAIMENFENMRGPVLDKLVEVITMLGGRNDNACFGYSVMVCF